MSFGGRLPPALSPRHPYALDQFDLALFVSGERLLLTRTVHQIMYLGLQVWFRIRRAFP